MSQAISPSAREPFGLIRVCRTWEVPRSTVYARRVIARSGPRPPVRRGPRGCMDDAALTENPANAGSLPIPR